MAIRLKFSRLPAGQRFNLTQKIALELGININDVSVSESDKATCLNLPDLTEAQIDKVNTIMATPDPCVIPSKGSNTAFNIPDIWNAQEWLKTQTGLNITFWLAEINGIPYVRMAFDHTLSLAEKKKLKDTLINNLTEQV